MSKCETCLFAVANQSWMGTTEDIRRKKIEYDAECDRILKEKSEKTSFFSYCKTPDMNKYNRCRSQWFECLDELIRVERRMECRRYPESRQVDKLYSCGEYKEKA